MEGWLIFFGVIGSIWFVVWLNNRVSSYNESKHRKKLDEIAYDVLAEFDFNKEREGIKSVGGRYVSKEHRCPRCNGMLVTRSGIYGKFWGCNHYPECRYTRNIKS